MWIYLQSFFIYIGLAWIMFMLGKRYSVTKKYIYIVVAISIYAIVFGLRYGVGGDYFSYKDFFEEVINYGHAVNSGGFEIGFTYLVKFLGYFKSPSLIFCVVAFLQLYLMVLGIKDKKYIYPYIFLCFILLGTWLAYANCLRQIIAVGLWIYSILFAVKKKPLQHYLLLLIALTFHNSTIIFFVFYPLIILKNEWLKSIKLQCFLLALSLVIMNMNFIQDVFARIDIMATFLGYSNYLTWNTDLIEKDAHIGIGFFIHLLLSITVIFYSQKVKTLVNSPYYNILYDFYFIGLLVSIAFVNSLLINRLNYFFCSHEFIIVAFTLHYLLSKKNKIISSLCVFLLILLFVALMYRAADNWSLFVFNWQEEYFYLHDLHK